MDHIHVQLDSRLTSETFSIAQITFEGVRVLKSMRYKMLFQFALRLKLSTTNLTIRVGGFRMLHPHVLRLLGPCFEGDLTDVAAWQHLCRS